MRRFRKLTSFILIILITLMKFNISFAEETWWWKGSNGSWLYKVATSSNPYANATYEWSTISVGAIYYPSMGWGKQNARVFARSDAVKQTYSQYNTVNSVYVTDIKSALKDVNGTGNTYDRLTITEAYPVATTSARTIDSLAYTLGGYIWNGTAITLDLIANVISVDQIVHWNPSGAPERERYVMISDTGLITGLKNVSLPTKDNYDYLIPHN